MVPSRSVRYRSAAHTATTATSAASVMARCRRGRRPANIVAAAPSREIRTGSGVNTLLMARLPLAPVLARTSLRSSLVIVFAERGSPRPLQPRQRVQLVRLVGIARRDRLWARFVEGDGLFVRHLRDAGVLRVVAD